MSEEFSNASSCSPSDCASCGMECGSRMDEGHNTITLTLEDDTEVECAILTIYPVNKKDYIALLPLDENGQNQSGEVYLYSFSRTESGDPMLSNIDDDQEYDAAAEAFQAIVENAKGRKKRTGSGIIPGSFFFRSLLCFTALLFCGASQSAVSDGAGVIVHCDSVFYEDSLHKTCSRRNFHCFSLAAVVCQFHKNMAFVV